MDNPENKFDGITLGVHCAKCGDPIIRGTTPYKKIDDEYYHEWCLEDQTLLGTCYPDAWRYVMQHADDNPILVHGMATGLSGQHQHAWVELPDGTIWDPAASAVFTKERYFELVKAVGENRYTVEEAALMLNVGQHGPWTDEERATWLHESVPASQSSRLEQLEQEGRLIAEQLGNGVNYAGPLLWDGPEGKFYGHLFQDDAVTVSSFTGIDFEGAKTRLIEMRQQWDAEPPVFEQRQYD